MFIPPAGAARYPDRIHDAVSRRGYDYDCILGGKLRRRTTAVAGDAGVALGFDSASLRSTTGGGAQ
ncbi:hypothetical protein [Arthrobacter sp. 35W]|uniref:hypothetical protein n=1 Tax=Arthrobacter sp. 35W TaxID=1132441 RepID=UPI00041C4176|nr:hypothetical protein [Arthrobacter sp. 35W]